jgi:GNAT superfamily N-acetyltransferase
MIFKRIYIITSGEKIRSAIQKKPTPSKCAWIEPLAVLPEMHRKGIATKLLEYCKMRTIQLKMSGIKLIVRPNNRAAIRLYEKLGFICSGHNKYTDIYTLTLKEEITDEIKLN